MSGNNNDVIQHKAYRSGCQELLLTVRNYAIEEFTISTSWPYDDEEIPFRVRTMPLHQFDEQSGQPINPYDNYTYKPDDCYVSFQYFKERFLDKHDFVEVKRENLGVVHSTKK